MDKSTIPIDRGWAWLVMLAGFGLNLTTASLAKSFGVLLVDFQEKFNCSAWAITTTQGTSMALWLALAPISNALAVRFTERKIVFIGGVVGTLGFVGSSQAPSLPIFFFFQGIVVGTGFGLAYSPSLVIIIRYFRKRLGLATGFAQTGIGVGTILIPAVLRQVVSEYGLHGCVLLQGALMAHVCVCAFLMRPVTFYDDRRKFPKNDRPELISQSTTNYSDSGVVHPRLKGSEETVRLVNDCDEQLHVHLAVDNSGEYPVKEGDTGKSEIKTSVETKHTVKGNNARFSTITSITIDYDKIIFAEQKKLTTTSKFSNICHYLGCSLLCDPVFLIYFTGGLFSDVIFECSYMMLPAVAIFRKFTRENASLVATIIGVSDLSCRFLIGPVFDLGCLRRKYMFCCTSILAGLVSLSVPFTVSSNAAFVTLCVFYGVLGACNIPLTYLVLADELGREKVSRAYGILFLFQGIGIILTAQIVGALVDYTGSWDTSFFFTASICLFGGVVMCLDPMRRFVRFIRR